MASTFSPNLRIELIATGEQSNTWGLTTNTNLGTLIEQAISGLVSVSVTAADETLTALNGVTDQSRQMIVVATGTPGVTRTITAPAVNKVYIVFNNSDATLNFIASGGTGVSLIAGAKKIVYSDGTNFSEAITTVATADFATTATTAAGLSATLVVGSGGTGSTTLTANSVLLGNATSALQEVAPSTSGNVLTSNGTTWASTAPAASGITTGKAIAMAMIFGF